MSDPIRKTRRAWDEAGHAHFVTYSCFRRLPLLTRARSRQWVIDAIAAVRREQDVAIWGYVVMPEHVHVLLCPRCAEYEMRTILAGLKRPVSKAARAHLFEVGARPWLDRLTVRYPDRTVFRFWQPGGGFDRNVVEERSVPAILDYMHANPVRRELCAAPTNWEWSSARFWEGSSDVPLFMDDPREIEPSHAAKAPHTEE
ncbi:MAG: transposase [Planctomycetes bacterium]|nr:transposase [Planctomycetota bacterium]